jgi:hypothetical protein
MNPQNTQPTGTGTGTVAQPTNETCPSCGMAKADWRGNDGQGFQVGNNMHCCQGCATGTGCTCK